jgi:hypothetical protein
LDFSQQQASSAQDAAQAGYSIWLPARPWALEMQTPGFSVEKNDIQPDGRRYFLAENKANKIVASVYLEAMSGVPARGECQRSLHAKETQFSPLSKQGLKDVAYSEKDGMEILEYLLPEVQGAPIKQHNVFACLIKRQRFRRHSPLEISLHTRGQAIVRRIADFVSIRR